MLIHIILTLCFGTHKKLIIDLNVVGLVQSKLISEKTFNQIFDKSMKPVIEVKHCLCPQPISIFFTSVYLIVSLAFHFLISNYVQQSSGRKLYLRQIMVF